MCGACQYNAVASVSGHAAEPLFCRSCTRSSRQIQTAGHTLNGALPATQTTAAFQAALSQGQVTEKEKALWEFVLSAYGEAEFSTKQLEKDFGNAAYATIRSFVLKFERLGLLRSVQYGSRTRYAVRMG